MVALSYGELIAAMGFPMVLGVIIGMVAADILEKL
jgi:hypothetical protein